MSVYLTVLKPGDTVMGLALSNGGHLTHGHHLNFSGKYYQLRSVWVRKDTETIDYDELDAWRGAQTETHRCRRQRLSTHARVRARRQTARETGAMMMVDMAHIAG
jgi:glycine hydroxymethyltransferase